ncbi:flagellar biosynthesis regulator FlaF [Agrobacterium salinitolerans]|nr:flagellar biosynthesis regulator FlaF [Agrobacterium salinitolerans]
MYQMAYAEIAEDSLATSRSREREAFDRSITLLQAAARKDHFSHEAVEAIQFTNQLWSALITDLSSPENQLSEQLRANLISIGMWILDETDRIRRRLSLNFQGIIDITSTIRAGLAH